MMYPEVFCETIDEIKEGKLGDEWQQIWENNEVTDLAK